VVLMFRVVDAGLPPEMVTEVVVKVPVVAPGRPVSLIEIAAA
jgi:hypothetical protein